MEENAKKLKEKKSRRNRTKNRAKQSENRAKTGLCETSQSRRILYEISTLLLNHSATHLTSLRKFFAAAKPSLAHECHFAAQWHPFWSCKMGYEVGCENSFLLRNQRSFAKLKMTFNILLFLYIPVIWVSKGKIRFQLQFWVIELNLIASGQGSQNPKIILLIKDPCFL